MNKVVGVVEEVGIYFNNVSKEIFARASLATALPDGGAWAKVSDDSRLGLLAVRKVLVEAGFVVDPRPVYWYGTNLKPNDDRTLEELLAGQASKAGGGSSTESHKAANDISKDAA